jgi:ATP-binding cassette subfamily F protein 2
MWFVSHLNSYALQEYIARFGHGSAKLARQAQSKEKTLEKMVRGGLTERVETDKVVRLKFENVGKLPPPVLQFSGVAFGYSPSKILYRCVVRVVGLLSAVVVEAGSIVGWGGA